jgi:hypothetical protein
MLLVVSLSLQPELYDGIIVKVPSTADSCGQLSRLRRVGLCTTHFLTHCLAVRCVCSPR